MIRRIKRVDKIEKGKGNSEEMERARRNKVKDR